ncbi:uncharacterized protein E6C27_scaffold1337G00230 [Cucumis melo var. makuwa]|uniref:Uncharacterized protein n=1 Tax=Cucumis melo var. makuwa TaxID=1194695 RepID=A0A5A7V7B5_CUCMM|nr:uncharacterized protein E6C27_scaffold1337G00230 [Cucumis melo var. makuwa]
MKNSSNKKNGGYINEDVQQVANEIDEILDKSLNDESLNDALSQALGTPEYGSREKVLENMVKEKKGIATSVPLISLTSKKKVVEEEEVKKEEVISTRPSISKNEGLNDFPILEEFEKDQKNNILESGKGIVECGYYVMRYMSEIVSKDTSIITDAIDTRNSYSQLELDEVPVEWAEFLACHYTYIHEAIDARG